MTFEEAKAFVSVTGNVSRLGLERMEELLRLLGNPEKDLRFVHVAGTNGKGSICAMTSAVLCAAGYKVGLYTSPHLFRLNERIQINGNEIPDADFAALADAIAPSVEKMEDKPTEFERFTAMALLYFSRQMCDIVVLEVGLGGRYDATNIISAPVVSVIANIGLDHTERLGDTVEKIAFEKGGIIKAGCPTVLYHQSEGVEDVIKKICAPLNSELHISKATTLHTSSLEGPCFDYKAWKNVRTSLIGTYQSNNAAVVLEAVEVLCNQGWKITKEAVLEGLKSTVWPARMEILSRSPLVLLDGAHNPNGVEALVQSLRELLPNQQLTFVMGVMADKDSGQMIDLIAPLANTVVAAHPEYYRALSSEGLETVLGEHLSVPIYNGGSLSNALQLAKELSPNGPICVFGSLYQAGEVRAFFKEN